MGLFGNKNSRKNNDLPHFSAGQYEPVLKCSICTGEQVFCIIDRDTGKLKELMMISSPALFRRICDANGVDPDSVRKIY